MKKFFTCLGATAAYWVCIFIGPAIVMWLNNIGYYFTGGGYGPGSLMYKVLHFLSQPVSCLVAYAIAMTITKTDHPICVLSNCIVGACVCGLFTIVSILAGNTRNAVIMPISAIACIGTAIASAKELASKIAPELAPQNIGEMTPTKRSSTIEAVLHKDENLYIKLRTGDMLGYRKLPRKVYIQLMNAPSMGDYYRKHIKGRYVETKL